MSEQGDRSSPEGSSDRADDATQATMPRWDSEELLCGGRETIIVHGEDEYRLRQTRNNKLILYK